MLIPRFYPIADAEAARARGLSILEVAAALREARVELLQYRDKTASDDAMLDIAEQINRIFVGSDAGLILNDRAEVMRLAGWDGLHIGQQDMEVEDARRLLSDGRVLGLSTHNENHVRAAEMSSADYIAIGPIFATGSKLNPDPVVGLDGVRRARALTAKPLVAIGGITRANARSLIEAGADSVAVISGLFAEGETVAQVARDFLELLG
jgi:thiamine-phosphate pyrophosphorylase